MRRCPAHHAGLVTSARDVATLRTFCQKMSNFLPSCNRGGGGWGLGRGTALGPGGSDCQSPMAGRSAQHLYDPASPAPAPTTVQRFPRGPPAAPGSDSQCIGACACPAAGHMLTAMSHCSPTGPPSHSAPAPPSPCCTASSRPSKRQPGWSPASGEEGKRKRKQQQQQRWQQQQQRRRQQRQQGQPWQQRRRHGPSRVPSPTAAVALTERGYHGTPAGRAVPAARATLVSPDASRRKASKVWRAAALEMKCAKMSVVLRRC